MLYCSRGNTLQETILVICLIKQFFSAQISEIQFFDREWDIKSELTKLFEYFIYILRPRKTKQFSFVCRNL